MIKMAVRTIRTRLVIEGDKEFADKLKKVNSELAEQKSKYKLLTEEYKNNQNSQEALSKKIEQLKEVQKSQIKVVEAAHDGLMNATKEQGKYSAQVEEARSKIEAAQIELEKLNTATDEGSKKQAEFTAEIEKYQAELEEAQKKQGMAAESADDWAMKQSKAQTQLNGTSTQIKRYEGYLKEAEESTDKCATSIDQYGKKVGIVAKKQDEMNDRLHKSGDAVDSLAAALVASGINKGLKETTESLRECIEMAAGFEKTLAKVSTIADTDAMSMTDIKKEIINLSNETGKAVSELSEATYNAISASVETAGAVDFIATSTKLATGGFTDDATAVDILTTAVNAYQLELKETQKISDYLITTQNLGKTTVNELAAQMGKVIPVAAAYNVKMDNLSSAMAVLTANGISTAESTTYLKAAINELGDSNKTVAKVLLSQTGMSFSELMSRGKSLGDIMEILAQSVDNDKGAFNELWGSTEAGIAALSLLSTGSEKYNEVLDKMKNSAGATEAAYAKMADTSEMAQQKFTNSLDNLKIAIGSQLQDQMKGAYEKGTDLLAWASEFVEKNQWLIPVLEGVTIGIGALAAAVAGFTITTEIIIPLLNTFTAALAANPIGLVAVAVGVLVAALAPLIADLSNTTTEVQRQAEAWKEQANALNEAVDGYQKHNNEMRQTTEETEKLAKKLSELVKIEDKSVTEKESIASIVDKLNEKIPNLELKYDGLSDSLNRTVEELDTLIELMELQEKYENAQENYVDIYAENQAAMEALAEAQEALTEAQEKWNAASEENITTFNGNMDACMEASSELYACTEAVNELQAAVSQSNSALAGMRYDMNMYTIETASMTEAERETINVMLEKAEAVHGYLPAYYEEIEAVAKTAQGYNDYASAVKSHTETVIQQIIALQEKYEESYQSAYENIQQQIGLFNEMQVGTSESIDEMISSLGTQVTYMEDYAKNIKLAMEYGVDEGIIKQLTDGSTESAAILQEIVNSGQGKIDELNEEFARVSEGKDEFSTAIAELEAYYGEEMDQLVKDTEEAVKEMAKYDDAYQSAVFTCDGILAGIDSKWSAVIAKYQALGRATLEAYNKEQKIESPSKKFKWSAEMSMEGIKTGVESKKEEVMKSYKNVGQEVKKYNNEMKSVNENGKNITLAERLPVLIQEGLINGVAGGNKQAASNTVTQTFNIYQPVKSPSEMMRAARLEQQYGLAGV